MTPSSPCMGTERGGATYTAERYGGQYAPFAGPGPASYTAGQSFEATIVLDADHNGEAQWQFCPHSQEETEECFRENPVSDWVDVHAYWDSSNQEDHWKSGEHFSQTVTLPSGVPAGPGTLRWLWVCKYTDEIFLSCIDVNVASGSGDPQPAPAPAPAPAPSSTSHAPESCTAEDEDPYGSGSEVQCCDGLQKCLGDWSGNGKWHYNCKTSCGVQGSSSRTASTPSSSAGSSQFYDQCGGKEWEGPTRCVSGSTCTKYSEYYSQCVPAADSTSFLSRKRSAVVRAHQHSQK